MAMEFEKISWEKVKSAPSKGYKIQGYELLALRDKMKEFNTLYDETLAKIDALETKIRALESANKDKSDQIAVFQVKITKLNDLISSLENVVSTKDESMGATMRVHASFMKEIEKLSEEVATKDKESADLLTKISELQDEKLQMQNTSSELEKQISAKENDLNQIKNQINELQGEIKAKENSLAEKNETINVLNKKIQELEEQIPKKPILEKAEEVVKGTPCPNCGSITYEEYNIIEGTRQLIKKYCPNPNCGWYSRRPRE